MPFTPMFWRIVRRLLTANYGRLFVILLALGAGAAVTAALLNLQIDAKKRLTTEFRALGANVIVAPKSGDNTSDSLSGPSDSAATLTLDESLLKQIPEQSDRKAIPTVAFLYVIGEVAKSGTPHFEPAVIAGAEGAGIMEVRPGRRAKFDANLEQDPASCEVGTKAAAQFQVHGGDTLRLRNQGREATCKV